VNPVAEVTPSTRRAEIRVAGIPAALVRVHQIIT
jgi:hypothetical protein